MEIISKKFENNLILFQKTSGNVFINATESAKSFNKAPKDWLKTTETKKYIEAVGEIYNLTLNEMVIVRKGNFSDGQVQGTWLHQKLIIAFARWLSPYFAVWCDFQIEEILSSKTSNEPDLDQIRKRTELLKFSGEQFEVFEKIFLKIGISEKNELAITSNRAVKKETGIDFIKLAELKGLEAKEKFFTVTELCEIVRNSDQFSNEFKIQISTKDGLKPRPQNLNQLLEFSNFQFRENGEWKLTEKGEDFGKLSQNKSKYSDKTVYHLVWSKRVLENLK
jgi:hypothetical protein